MWYVSGWTRTGDFGFVAVGGAGEPIGAAWARVFNADDPGYGFVAADVPEISMGVAKRHRAKGVGRLLLGALVVQAREIGHGRLSLSVEDGNRAANLYREFGFIVAGRKGGSNTLTLIPDCN